MYVHVHVKYYYWNHCTSIGQDFHIDRFTHGSIVCPRVGFSFNVILVINFFGWPNLIPGIMEYTCKVLHV